MEKYPGLSNEEVTIRLQQHGYNVIPSQKPKSVFIALTNILKEPMIFLLLSGGIVYFVLGELRDSIVLLTSIFVVIGITLYQDRKTEHALEALKELSKPQAMVIRNGERAVISSKDLVKDDIIVLQEGDRVPADGVVIATQNLVVDESLLTGESLPVIKTIWNESIENSHPGSNKSPNVYSGTLIVQGSGIAKVTATGVYSEMGKIGKSLQSITSEESLLKKEINRIVRIFGIIGLLLCLMLTLIKVLLQGDLLRAFLSGLTLSMSMLPEEFPVVLLIFFTLGAWRISKKQVLTRNKQAIETLGATTVLCVDKTGTITMNKMELASIVSSYGVSTLNDENIPEGNLEVLKYAKLASKRGAFDPLEKEINSKFEKYISNGRPPLKDWHLLKEYGLSKNLFAVSRVWSSPLSKKKVVGTKGAPETIIELCGLNESDKKILLETVQNMSKQGQRVLGVASGEFEGEDYPDSQNKFKLKFLGLVGFHDPIRPTVHDSVKECYAAGIRIIMITGDYPGTAQFIASLGGIRNTEKYITGADLENMSKEELKEKIREVNIYCRVVPEQKLNIIEALKSNNEVVAMTGDGVNDGPALKTAHIGIAMGQRGTDVARESADLVLLNDDFTSIVDAVKLGRRIYDNLQKAVSYIFSIHIPIAGAALIPAIFNLPTMFFPVHIAFLELVIDPASSTVFEAERSEEGIMKRSPRKINSSMFDRSQMLRSLLNGLILLVMVLLSFFIVYSTGNNENTARAVSFITLVLCNLILIFSDLTRNSTFKKFTWHKNKALFWILSYNLVFVVLVSSVPFFTKLFHFSAFGFSEWEIIIGLVSLCYVLLEILKLIPFAKHRSVETIVDL